jgi:hypothetical protein
MYMETKNLIVAVLLVLTCGHATAQVSSGKTSFSFNNAPVLVIEQISFDDENKNNFADAGEKCFLLVKIKNTGKSTAKSVNIQINSVPQEQSFLAYEKSFAVGNIQIGETKEVKIPIYAGASLVDTQTNLELLAREANNYDSKPANHLVMGKAGDAKMAINWYNPQITEINVSEVAYTLKACVVSAFPVEEVDLFINNKPYMQSRGFKLIKSSTCDNYFEQEIQLGKGSNLIQLVAKGKTKKAESEIRNIVFDDAVFEHRTALVIGNAKYSDAPLKNPGNDAKAMAKTLRELNFEVIEVIDGDLPTIRKAIRDFHTLLSDNRGVGLFYYAGHGVQSKGENFIIPINHDIKEEFEVPDRAIRVNGVLEAMESTKTRMNIVILDACRNNPYTRGFRSGSRGLAQIYAEGTGSIIAYATAPGSVAADGEGENGLYTQELLKAIKTPGLEIGMVFRNVLSNVRKISNGQQLPWTNSSIEGEFYFVK